MISAVCITEVEVATALCSCAVGTMPGSSAAMLGRSKACAAPSTVTAAKTPQVGSQPCQMPSAMKPMVTASIT